MAIPLEAKRTETSVKLSFATAWLPPIGLYDYLVERGIGVTVCYVDTGLDVIGSYVMGAMVLTIRLWMLTISF